MLINLVKSKWNVFAQAAIWIMAIISTFLISPPLQDVSDTSDIKPLTRFIIASVIALIFIPILARSKKVHYKLWYGIAASTFVLFILCMGVYSAKVDSWSVKYSGERLVIGETISNEALIRKKEMAKDMGFSDISLTLFVEGRAGATKSIWPLQEIRRRSNVLSFLYIITVVWVSFFTITIVQAIYCYEQKL